MHCRCNTGNFHSVSRCDEFFEVSYSALCIIKSGGYDIRVSCWSMSSSHSRSQEHFSFFVHEHKALHFYNLDRRKRRRCYVNLHISGCLLMAAS